ncbi:MAG: class I SAM-dependent methyltransferase [Gammaproteobacteria bacterium]
MLIDPAEIAIIAKARQANVRDPKRSRQHFVAIFEDFLSGVPFTGQTVLDIGPGQYDFGEMARARGASVIGIDRDPAVIELGRYKRFEVIEADLRDFHRGRLAAPVHGIFCKYSLNALWFHNDERGLRAHTQAFIDALRLDGWAWIAPWNRSPKALALSAAEEEAVLDVQRDCFMAAGFDFRQLSEAETRRYGVHGATADNALFTRGL